MNQAVIVITLGLLGLCLGSFAGATVWRLRARQLVEDKVEGEKIDQKEYKQLLPLTKTTPTTDRSRCLHCNHILAWYDLLPLASWISTGGKCRYCHQSIGLFEPLIELGVAAFFVMSFLLWPTPLVSLLAIGLFTLWLIAGVSLAILFAYDLKWFLLPDRVMLWFITTGIVVAILHTIGTAQPIAALLNLLYSALILSGLYLTLWVVSRGSWIGFGDVKLGLGLALLLGDWRLALLTLLLANLIGCLVVLPLLATGKISRKSRVPFGPLLIAGAIIAGLIGHRLIDWYLSLLI